MNIAFSHVFPKKAGTLYQKPTHFIHKIQRGIEEVLKIEVKDELKLDCAKVMTEQGVPVPTEEIVPKIHTIRRDEKKRWKAGMNLHFVMFQRRPWQIRFAPVLPVKAVEQIKIEHYPQDQVKSARVFIDGKNIGCVIWNKGFENEPIVTGKKMVELIKNDGFDSVQDFFQYFNENFEGKLIHWTDKVYGTKNIEVNDAEEVTGRKCDCFMGANDPERTCQCETPEEAIQRMNNSKR